MGTQCSDDKMLPRRSGHRRRLLSRDDGSLDLSPFACAMNSLTHDVVAWDELGLVAHLCSVETKQGETRGSQQEVAVWASCKLAMGECSTVDEQTDEHRRK